MRALAIVAALLVAACAETPTKTRDTVDVPVGTPCLTRDKVPQKPQFVTDAQLKVMRGDSFVTSLYADRIRRIDYEEKLEARIEGCVGGAPVPAPLAPTPAPDAAKPPRWQFWR